MKSQTRISSWTKFLFFPHTIQVLQDGQKNFSEYSSSKHSSGDGVVASSSYEDNAPLKPDNWLVTPQLNLQGTMKVWLCAQDVSYSDEHFAIYLSTTGTNITDFKTVLVDESIATSNFVEQVFYQQNASQKQAPRLQKLKSRLLCLAGSRTHRCQHNLRRDVL